MRSGQVALTPARWRTERPPAVKTTPQQRSANAGTAVRLQPKEHGAYAILGVPLGTALILGGFSPLGLCIASAAVSGFLSHEPMLILLGHRGARAKNASSPAMSRLLFLLVILVLGGSAAFVFGDQLLRLALIGCALLAATSFAVALLGKHRTLAGQLWGVLSLTAPCVPIQLAGGMQLSVALAIWTAWVLGFIATTIGVRGVIAAQKRSPRRLHYSILTVVCLVVLSGILMRQAWLVVTLPMLAMSWQLLMWPPPARHLKRVGWSLVAGTLVSATLVLWNFA